MTPDRSAAGLITPVQNTWCPGCGNFSIQHMMRSHAEISEEGIPIEVRLLGGIGATGNDGLPERQQPLHHHGRSIPAATDTPGKP